ncbi:MAG: cytochrome P450 [Proteobacteria bacterium]|nr:cytochrome P450 [Pseudomonadota bacterium]
MAILRDALPPGPRHALIQTLHYLRDPREYTLRMGARYGDPFSMPTMNGPLVLALGPEGIREILAGRESDFTAEFGVDAIAPIVGQGSLLLISGERHQRERKLLSPVFHGARMRSQRSLIQDVALREVAGWQPGRTLRMRERMQAVSLQVILRVVFGVESPEKLVAFGDAVRLAVSEINPAPIFLKFLQHEFGGIGPWARFRRRQRQLDNLLYSHIAVARHTRQRRDDVLSRLVDARLEDGSALSDQSLRDQLLTILVAGHETTATALAWVFYELSQAPEVLEQVRDEIAGLGPDPNADELAELPLLQAVCQESLRLHPVLPEFFRTVKTQFSLLGYEIPAGVTLAGSILALHENESLYPEARRFRPERFLERRFAPHEFAAFGGGHRRCLGAAFAMNELLVALGTILPQVELSLAVPAPLRTVRRNGILAPEREVPMRVERRLVGSRRAAA